MFYVEPLNVPLLMKLLPLWYSHAPPLLYHINFTKTNAKLSFAEKINGPTAGVLAFPLSKTNRQFGKASAACTASRRDNGVSYLNKVLVVWLRASLLGQ